MLGATPHAPAPADASSRAWVGFAVGEAGQLEKSNADKAGVSHILTVCESDNDEAYQSAKHQLKHWWQKIF
jgi:hypothetical protein